MTRMESLFSPGEHTARLFLLCQGPGGRDAVVITWDQRRQRNIHPARCIDLGRHTRRSAPVALRQARKLAAEPASVVAANVRAACEGRGGRGFADDEIEVMRQGGQLRIRDSLGEIACRWTPI